MKINPQIFKSYDIRGIVGEDLDKEIATQIGKAFGTYIQQYGETKTIVGHDNRSSSEELKAGLIEGLISTGIHVIDIGMATTPIVYYSRKLLKIGPAIQITASHNPSQYNGFKMCIEENAEAIYGDRIQEIGKLSIEGNFKTGDGSVETKEILSAYINEITQKIKLGNRKLKIVVDCANGTACMVAVELLQKLGAEVIPLYCESDCRFPNHHPDPAVPENLVDLAKVVLENKADAGIGFDGDGDRIGIVDEKGNPILGDMFMLIMWRDIINRYPGAPALVEVKCSQTLWDELEKIGAKPEFIRTGNPYIKAAMKEKNVPFSGEMSGHIFFRDEYYGFDDATYAAARFLKLLSNTTKPTSELLDGINHYITTPEIMKDVKEAEKFAMVDRAIQYFKDKGYKVVDVDGARVVFEKGWGLIRASNTSPKISIRYEAKNEEELKKIEEEFEQMLAKVM